MIRIKITDTHGEALLGKANESPKSYQTVLFHTQETLHGTHLSGMGQSLEIFACMAEWSKESRGNAGAVSSSAT